MLLKKADQFFRKNKYCRRLIACILILMIGWIDHITNPAFSMAVFYLIPISIIAWCDSRKATCYTLILCSVFWLGTECFLHNIYYSILIPYWKVFVRICFFSFIAYLELRMRDSIEILRLMALKDNLTELDNRHALEYKYKNLQKISARHCQAFAVGLLDLDGFKAVNDQYGHDIGDQVLIRFAKVLSETSRKTDVVARLGGDEFMVIIQVDSATNAEIYSHRLRQAFIESGLKQQYHIEFSMGMYWYTSLPQDFIPVKKITDQLMYDAKFLGKARTLIKEYSS